MCNWDITTAHGQLSIDSSGCTLVYPAMQPHLCTLLLSAKFICFTFTRKYSSRIPCPSTSLPFSLLTWIPWCQGRYCSPLSLFFFASVLFRNNTRYICALSRAVVLKTGEREHRSGWDPTLTSHIPSIPLKFALLAHTSSSSIFCRCSCWLIFLCIVYDK